ncbi:MAG: DUF1697 domain-containing protein [Anaerolineales bacterium]
MADLRALVAELSYSGVRTLLNSGNVVFDADETDTAEASARIEQALDAHLHVSAQVLVLSAAGLAAVVAGNPLTGIASDPSRLMVTFHSGPVDPGRLEHLLLQDWSPEALALGAHSAYLWCPAGFIKSRLARAAERALADSLATTRNWATVLKLDALAKAEALPAPALDAHISEQRTGSR